MSRNEILTDKYTGLCQHHPMCQLLITRGVWPRGECSQNVSWTITKRVTTDTYHDPTNPAYLRAILYGSQRMRSTTPKYPRPLADCTPTPFPRAVARFMLMTKRSQISQRFSRPMYEPVTSKLHIYTSPIEIITLDNKWTKIVKSWPFSDISDIFADWIKSNSREIKLVGRDVLTRFKSNQFV